MTIKPGWFAALLLGMTSVVQAAPETLSQPVSSTSSPGAEPGTAPAAPVRNALTRFSEIAPPPGNFTLLGTRTQGQIEFGVRSDEVVTKAVLNLTFRPSPSLIPSLSHLKVYLNDELAGLVPITAEELGKTSQVQVPIDPRFIGDFNRIRLELVGHYANICENPANSAIWLEIGKASTLELALQKLPVKNDLSHFPEPFFDARESRPLSLPMIFAAAPDVGEQRAAAVLASWFGTKADWRGQTFPVLYNALPEKQHAVVFATNSKRPDFLKTLPPVDKPTVEMIDRPGNPYQKLLLILGRDDNDLLTAVQGIAQGEILLRGQASTIDSVKALAARQPYDAPNWVRTDRATTFGELQQFQGQLQADGMQPGPIALTLKLPPDLFLVRARGIDVDIKYRYTSPVQDDGSRLAVNLNDQFVQDYALTTKREEGKQLLRIPLVQGLLDNGTRLTIPALQLGEVNQLRFDFDYASTFIGGSYNNTTSEGRCETITPVTNHVVIDPNSTVDFSGYRHYMEMPSLGAFANAGFPFSRSADLAQTLVLVSGRPEPEKVSALLNALGNISAQTGYPALKVQITDDWNKAKSYDADLLMIGTLPADMKGDVNLLVDAAKSWVNKPNRQTAFSGGLSSPEDRQAESQTTISSTGPVAALVGFQSPFAAQRSVVALLADSPQAWSLLNGALIDSGKRAAIFGSASIIRDSGVNSLQVGETYWIGHLPWYERLWNALATHPILLALFAAVVVVVFALLVWRVMRRVSRHRLGDEDDRE
ncbi:cellulose biosynthesis cyclic di-GMP-binding regulatory protein BcsB [Erwinia sp. MMLR14_017]|uniref:cellulose biosynthesis cyclic di-GMP-binding regulatory protein BcsB n=1 Tax=Erwinia sp. MMLR14_017 TaxID=3093842 RepID=UPI00298FBA6E|nr:cellulose biosynthesis cyclic di-GMP-binding regulatory protein BcsB [Erwinia sp. MMLR14_017]MDW8845119.1 cellulose biosynthesis cyclic di-GMP-binding regulatory protein BcsB [Erwinia sp. MMLR14_017]